MFEFLQPVDGPVIEGRESEEVVFAADQPAYNPLRALPIKVNLGGHVVRSVWSRWQLTPDQRAAIAAGEVDIYLELVTFNRPLQPIRLAVGRPEGAREAVSQIDVQPPGAKGEPS